MSLEIITKEINSELEKAEIQKALMMTTFKGFDLPKMKMAIFEGMSRGFSFKDFLEKNIYAIPYGTGYSLITSIDYARKLGMRGGVIGKSSPKFVEKDGKIISCEITIKKQIGSIIGEFTDIVYFDEYSTDKNLWKSKPRTMIAKVCEMHALRMACPEELSQAYVEEEMEKSIVEVIPAKISEDIIKKVNESTTEEQLKVVWEEHKGLGKEFATLVTNQKNFINNVKKDENNTPDGTAK